MTTTHINRLRCSISNTPGASGDVVVGAATSAARRTFTAAEDGKSFEPTFEDGNNWEVRTGCVYTHSTSTLTRGTLVDSSTGSAIALTSAAIVGLHGTAKAMQDLEPARALSSSAGVCVDYYGAAGDGVTVDSSAIALAVAAAGVNGVLRFTPNKTYLVDRSIVLLGGQTLIGFGATVKRKAQTTTTTTTGITTASTSSVTVSAGTGANFSVGQTISASNGANYCNQNITIQSIVGDVITTSTTFYLSGGSPWSGTTTIALSFHTITTAAGCSIYGLSIDGNKANWSLNRWEITNEILAVGANQVIEHVSINNAPGEAIMETGAGNFADAGNKYKNNTITNCNGNGFHLSASNGVQVVGNYIYNTNIDGATVGHNGGCITLSNGIKDALISGNHLDTGRSGVGQVDSSDNSLISIVGNTVHNMSAYMLELRGYDANVTDILVTGNRFYNDTAPAAGSLINVAIEDTHVGSISRISVTANNFYNAGLVCGAIVGCSITGNLFENTYQANDTYHNAIVLTKGTHIAIFGNVIKYGNAGITLNGNLTGVTVSGNNCSLQYYYGIYAVGSTNSNVMLSNNSVVQDNNVNGSAQAFVIGPNSVAKNNNINITAGYCGLRVNGVANAVVQGNTVRASGAGKTIRVETGSTGYVVTENTVNYAVVDTPGVGVRVANNDVIV